MLSHSRCDLSTGGQKGKKKEMARGLLLCPTYHTELKKLIRFGDEIEVVIYILRCANILITRMLRWMDVPTLIAQLVYYFELSLDV